MNPTILGVIDPGFLNQVPTFGNTATPDPQPQAYEEHTSKDSAADLTSSQVQTLEYMVKRVVTGDPNGVLVAPTAPP